MGKYRSPGVYVEEVPPLERPIAGVGTSTPGFIGVIPDTIQLPAATEAGDDQADRDRGFKVVDFPILAVAGSAHFVTTWSQYTNLFGDFVGAQTEPATAAGVALSRDAGQRDLAHAVFGFFRNGGTGCYVARVAAEGDVDNALRAFAAIDEITIVVAPGLIQAATHASLTAHCVKLEDRVAVLDPVENDTGTSFEDGDFTDLKNSVTDTEPGLRPPNTNYAAFYFPWIQVADPASILMQSQQTPPGQGLIHVPPSGHIAGIYARNDATRGVHKAPANEAVLGAVGLRWALSKADQDQLNDDGVNIIRALNGAIRVWGARTVGGKANDYKYISTRRYLSYLRESIDEGTQWVVFEPNTSALWERIKRSVGGFLMREWRDGRLFGETPDKAFFVRCDEDLNPSTVRDAGQVITEIGVAIIKPAEFVIFRIQRISGS